MDLPRLEDLGDLQGQRVLVRCDFNVPMADGAIVDDLRIRAALPTLRYLVDAGAQVTVCCHLGRPKGEPDPAYSLDPIRKRLADLAPQSTCWRTYGLTPERLLTTHRSPNVSSRAKTPT